MPVERAVESTLSRLGGLKRQFGPLVHGSDLADFFADAGGLVRSIEKAVYACMAQA